MSRSAYTASNMQFYLRKVSFCIYFVAEIFFLFHSIYSLMLNFSFVCCLLLFQLGNPGPEFAVLAAQLVVLVLEVFVADAEGSIFFLELDDFCFSFAVIHSVIYSVLCSIERLFSSLKQFHLLVDIMRYPAAGRHIIGVIKQAATVAG